jgi:radical SAM superfamily enzyme YgiQ (UPF0313 family)
MAPMKVLIVSTNRCHEPLPVMPAGACLVAEAAERAGHAVRLLDMMFARDPMGALRRELDAFEPDVVGVSVRNIDSAEMLAPVSYYEGLARVAGAARVPVVLGGGAVSVMPGQLLRYSGAAWAVLGDGDVVFPRLLDVLARGADPRAVAGVGWLEDGRFRCCPSTHECPSRPIPAADYARWLRVRPYLRRFATAPVQTKRGCPFECAYCTYPLIEGRDYRLFPVEAVVGAVRRLVSGGIRDIEFVDNVFNAPYEQALAVCEALAAARPGARLQTVDVSPAGLDDRLLDAMERAGFVGIGVTAESAADPVLAGLRKEFDAARLRSAAEAVRRHALPCLWTFMFGGPGETRETALETLAFAESVLRRGDAAFFTVGLRVYPGTALEQSARRDGLLERNADLLRPTFYVSPDLDTPWLVETLREAAHRNLGFVQPLEQPGPLLRAARGAAYVFGMRPPIWKHARRARRLMRLLGR